MFKYTRCLYIYIYIYIYIKWITSIGLFITYIALLQWVKSVRRTRNNNYDKKKCYEDLLENMKNIKPTATKDSVVKKINSLPTVQHSERNWRKLAYLVNESGVGSEDIYVPKLWYFNFNIYIYIYIYIYSFLGVGKPAH